MKATSGILLLCLLSIFVFQAEAKWHKGKNKRRHEGHPLRNHLFPSWNAYDANVSPKESDLGEPVNVHVNMFVRELGPLNLDDNSFRVQLTIRQIFNDSRLSYKPKQNRPDMLTLSADEMDDLWLPDTFIRNERSVVFHNALKPNVYARVYSTGKVQTSQKVTLILSCPRMKKQFRDTGKLTCHVDIASYGYREEDMAFEWDPINSVQFGGQDTTSFLNDGIELEDHSTGRCDVETSTGKYSCIRLSFTFKKA